MENYNNLEVLVAKVCCKYDYVVSGPYKVAQNYCSEEMLIDFFFGWKADFCHANAETLSVTIIQLRVH